LAGIKRVAILGSTGSIGRSVLDVIDANPGAFDVVSLSALTSSEALAEQAVRFRPRRAALGAEASGRAALPGSVELLAGAGALEELASAADVDLVVNALVGTAGLEVTLAAVKAGKPLAIANKESLVMAGDVIMRLASKTGSRLIPIDSEHSSIMRCIRGASRGEVRGIVLTASGGPLRDLPSADLANADVESVLDHPTWDMGKKITVDSATLANKAMEVIEAKWLFGMPLDSIDVVIHRESVVHSFVRMSDGSLLAHLGAPDMRVPIQYALFYPDAPAALFSELMPADLGGLTFSSLEEGRYPCFDLILDASRAGGTAPAVACVADEVAVAAFLDHRIAFGDIPAVIGRTMDALPAEEAGSLELIVEAAGAARAAAQDAVKALERGARRPGTTTGGSTPL
jgi:1-deoxy-D-xylulose-5-phosphate reductoisomerase